MAEDNPTSPFPISIATSSLNPFPAHPKPPHDLPSKHRAIAHAGFGAIELAFPDFLSFATQHFGREIDTQDWDDLCVAAKDGKLLGLEVMMLQPFGNFEGWNADSEEGRRKRKDAFERASGWIRVMKELGTDMLQVGSTDSPTITTDKTCLAADLAQLADTLSEHSMRLAYENWCWATAAPTWRDVYDIVVLTDRPNVGLCLDTFQTAGGEWGDPTTATGRVNDLPEPELKERYLSSLQDLASTIPAENIYLLQVSDAYKPPRPLDPEPDERGLRPRGRWSGAFRPMPGKEGGYLPVVEMARAVKETGFRGWLSIEIFDGGLEEMGRELGDLDKEAEEIMELSRRFVGEIMKE